MTAGSYAIGSMALPIVTSHQAPLLGTGRHRIGRPLVVQAVTNDYLQRWLRRGPTQLSCDSRRAYSEEQEHEQISE
jgi:hypothetical protein